MRGIWKRSLGLLFALALVVAACGDNGDDADPAATDDEPAVDDTDDADDDGAEEAATDDETEDASDFEPEDTPTFIIYGDAGSGSDLFARGLAEILVDSGASDEQWQVENLPGTTTVEALAHLIQAEDRDDMISPFTPTWIVEPMTVQSDISAHDLTPIAQLIEEPSVLAANVDTPYDTLEEFIEYANDNPGEVTITGGSPSSLRSLMPDVVLPDADITLLSFPSGGERIAALLGGDADVMLHGAETFHQHVETGDLKILGVMGNEASSVYPDAQTLADVGLDAPPQQVRGMVGPPNMAPEAIAYYEEKFESLLNSDEFATYADENGWVPAFRSADEFGQILQDMESNLRPVLERLGLV